MKRLLLLFCLAMSMLTQASAQGNNPYVLHIYNGRIFTAPQADFLAATYLNDKFEMTLTMEGYSYRPVYSRNGKKLFQGIILNVYDVNMQMVGILNATVEDNFGFSFTQKEMSNLASTALAGYTGIVVDFSMDNLAINADNFPDQNFRVYLQAQTYGKDYVLTPTEISSITEMVVENKSISSLKGIEYFTALTDIDCDGNQLTSLDVSKNTALTMLSCSVNQLTSLDVSKNTALWQLLCYRNQLTSLDVSKNTALWYLDCENNQLTSLDVSKNTALTTLYCYGNKLTSLDVSKNTALTNLACYDNQLTSLDVSKNTALTTLYCDGNQLTSLDVSKNTALTTLYCFDNQIKGAQTEALVNSLPTVTDGKLYFCNPTNSAEKNEITDAQVAKAKAKGWKVYARSGSGWSEYAGISTGIAINAENFPDKNFREYLLAQSYGADAKLTPEEISSITEIGVSEKSISSLKGIEYFTALTYLSCSNNQLTSLDVSKNTALTDLYCHHNQLTSLDVSKNTKLKWFACDYNQLTSLDVSKNTKLKLFECDHNQLTSLDVSKNTALTELYCYNNQLTSLDVSKNTALTELYCYNNQLTSLDVSKNTALTELYCRNNNLTSLDVSKNTALTELSCDDNQLTSLDVSKNTALTELSCSINQLASLNVSKNTALTELSCYYNQIKGAQTEALVNSLPTVTDGKLYFCEPTYAAEKNEITDEQVAKAKAKGWTVYAWNGSDWEEFAGITGIGNVEQAEPGAVRTYTLDGRPVSGQPAKPGIYIRGGKKVIVK